MIYSFENIINIGILVMLLVMIGYCIVLNKRLKAFRNIKEEMADIINQLNSSTSRAEKAITGLKNTVFEEEKKLSSKLSKASEIADELDMINQTGSNLANRIEKGLLQNRRTHDEKNEPSPIFDSAKKDKISLSDLEGSEEHTEENDSSLRENLRNIR